MTIEEAQITVDRSKVWRSEMKVWRSETKVWPMCVQKRKFGVEQKAKV
jgi:hypothetical protein